MADYKSMYLALVDKIDKSIEILQSGLKEAEEIFIDGEETIINIVDVDNTEKDS